MIASLRTIRDYINNLGWKKAYSNYYQIASQINQMERFSYAFCWKYFNETYDDVLDIDETTIEIRIVKFKNWFKSNGLLAFSYGARKNHMGFCARPAKKL